MAKCWESLYKIAPPPKKKGYFNSCGLFYRRRVLFCLSSVFLYLSETVFLLSGVALHTSILVCPYIAQSAHIFFHQSLPIPPISVCLSIFAFNKSYKVKRSVFSLFEFLSLWKGPPWSEPGVDINITYPMPFSNLPQNWWFVYFFRAELQDAKQAMESTRKRVHNLESSRSNRIRRFGTYVPELLQKIQEGCRRRVFRKPPKGPLGFILTQNFKAMNRVLCAVLKHLVRIVLWLNSVCKIKIY